MKKLLLSVSMLVLGGSAAFAQGTSGVSVGLLASGQSLGLEARYRINQHFRLATNGLYAFDGVEKQNHMQFNLNAHYLFSATEHLAAYPLLGFGYNRHATEGDEGRISLVKGRMGVNFGLGFSYQVTPLLSFGTELKQTYQFSETHNNRITAPARLAPELSAHVMFTF